MRKFILVHDIARQRALDFVKQAPDGYEVVVRPAQMTYGQKARFHILCRSLEASNLAWQGRALNDGQWKLVMISAHAIATKKEVDLIVGVEGELINLRDSIADMGKDRGASLIEYVHAFCAQNNVSIIERKKAL